MDRRGPHPDISKRGLVRISLTCGHQITTRSSPLNNRSRYGCCAGEGCGYNIAWTSYQHHGSTMQHDNPVMGNEKTG